MILKEYRKGDQIFRLIKCDWCKKEVEIEKIRGKKTREKYCSKHCGCQHKNHSIIGIKKCLFCKNEFPVTLFRSKYCSKSCEFSHRKQKTRNKIDSLKFLRGERIADSEIKKRLNMNNNSFSKFINKYRLGKPENRIKYCINKKWSDSELQIMIDFAKKYPKNYPIAILKSELNRTYHSICHRLSVIRKQLAGE